MDEAKCKALKAELAVQPEPQVVPAERFFDGNNDTGSIGCNLMDHPGVARFRDVFARLASRPDVQAVYMQITELDPGESSWPFSDTVLVVGTISADDLRASVAELQPDEIGDAAQFGASPAVDVKQGARVWTVWWD